MTDEAGLCSNGVAEQTAPDDGSAFRSAYRGEFAGLLAWEDADRVFAAVKAMAENWWIYNIHESVPAAPVAAESLVRRIEEIEQFLKRNHKADYCGFVYVDDKVCPRLIKVFDPRNASSCGLGSPLPAYTISRMQPVKLPLEEAGASDDSDAARGGGFMQRILKRLT